MTPSARRRHRRDLVIIAAAARGLSIAIIADGMGLSRSRTKAILRPAWAGRAALERYGGAQVENLRHQAPRHPARKRCERHTH
jgi:hypothetical protein